MDNNIILAATTVIMCAANYLLHTNESKNVPKNRNSNKRTRGPDKQWIRRKEKGVMRNLVQELRLEDIHSYRNWMRMDEDCFNVILGLIQDDIFKQNTRLRESIKPDERLAITLKFYATGMTFRELAYIFRVGERTVSYIVKQVTIALIKRLRYTLQFPKSETEWREIAAQYWLKCNIPNCIGAIDGKHIVMQKPFNSGSHYHNYKGTESIVLMAIVDSNLLFRYVDVGVNGRISDGGVWDRCKINELIEKKELQIPGEEYLPQSGVKTPHYFVADAAFPLSPHLMKPFPERSLTAPQRIFNYRLSRARRCVECAFGILSARFRLFKTNIHLQPAIVRNLVMAACCLHNFLAVKSPAYIQLEQEINLSDIGIPNLSSLSGRNHSIYAKEVREKLCHYFLTEDGRIDWQYRSANVA